MRRADRLFQIIQVLRRGRLVTAAMLAERLEVSERTIYRDIRDLMASGVPIDGAAGVGYLLREGYDLPPLMFSRDELEALLVGARMAAAWAGDDLARAAAAALEKIESALPEPRRREIGESRLFVPMRRVHEDTGRRLDALRDAIAARRVVAFDYVRTDGSPSHRSLWPMGLFLWSRVWTVGGWCELRDDWRTFRVDRIAGLTILDREYEERPGRGFDDYVTAARGAHRDEPR